MQFIRLVTKALLGCSLLVNACSAQPDIARTEATSIHLFVDASDSTDQAKRLQDELASAGMVVAVPAETVDSSQMPFISQVRFYRVSDKPLAERALPALQRYRDRAVLVPTEDASRAGRVDIFLSTRDVSGSALHAPPSEPVRMPEAPVITDEAFRELFNPDDDSHDPLKSAPPTARAFLAAAKRADAIDDPLARCLAFPDLPGDRWSPSLVRQLCEFAHAPALTLAEAKNYVARGKFDALEARLTTDLQRHFETGSGVSEVIHRDLEVFSKSDSVGDTVRAWRQAKPNSAFAYAAEASFLEGQAWRARGSKTSDQVGSTRFEEMHRLAALAIEAAQVAVRIEPKLLPAWRTLIELGQLDSQPDVSKHAFQAAVEVDPGCYRLNQAWMLSLRPRWGGSYEEMDAFAATLAEKAIERPMLALVAVMPDWDRALDARDDHDLVRMAQLLKPHLERIPSPDALQALGSVYPNLVVGGRWEGIAYLLEAVRFGDCGACTKDSLGYDLIHIAGDTDWGLIHLQRQARDDPDDLTALLSIGQARYEQGRFREAIATLQPVLARAADKRMRKDTLILLAASYKGIGDVANAQRYAEQQARESANENP